jgi:hypothetical protein
MDFKVTNCYIEEGAVRTPEVLQEQMATFLSEDASAGAQAESFAATDCLKPVSWNDPPCSCLLPAGDQCVTVTPMYSQGTCTEATVAGTKRPTGQPFEVCVKDGQREEIELALPSMSYLFRLTSASMRASYTPKLLSLSADGCVMTPSFDPGVGSYQCSVNCEVGAHALIGAVRDVLDDYAISVVTESYSGSKNHPWTVVSTDPHALATEVALDSNLAPKHVRIMVGDKVYVNDAVGSDQAAHIYHLTVSCLGQSTEITSTTTPVPGSIRISNRDVEIEFLMLVMLFGSIGILFTCTAGRAVLCKVLERAGLDDPCGSCTKALLNLLPGRNLQRTSTSSSGALVPGPSRGS